VVAAVLALAIGIGATTTTFSVVSAMLLEPLPYRQPDRLVAVWQDASATGRTARDLLSPALFVACAARATTLENVGATRPWAPNLTNVAEPERLRGALVSAGYLAALQVQAAAGRLLTPADDAPDAPPVVVLSHGLWQRRFGATPGVIGTTIMLDAAPTRVVGVLPPDFDPPTGEAEIFAPLRIDPQRAPRGLVVLRVLARLRPGATVQAAQAELGAIAGQLRHEDPEWTRLAFSVVSLHDDLVGGSRATLLVLSGAVVLVLLLACANVASLLLARAIERAREITIRAVLGASRARIVRQLLTESLVLAGVAGTCGVLMAAWSLETVVALAPPGATRLLDVRVDRTVLLSGLVATAATAVLTALGPALWASQVDLSTALRGGGRSATTGMRGHSVLIVLQLAIAMVLTVGATLLVRTLLTLERVDLGFRPAGVITASLSPPRGVYRDDQQLRALYTPLLTEILASPHVQSAGLVSVLPLSGMTINMDFGIEGRPPARSPNESPIAGIRVVTSRYFATLGMRMIEGREFGDDDREGHPLVAVVNETLARRYWPGESAVGKRVRVDAGFASVVGVVADVRHRGPAAAADAELYLSLPQVPPRAVWIAARTALDAAAAGRLLREAVSRVDRNLPVAQVIALDTLLGRSLAETRFVAALLSTFSLAAATLAVIGVYGTVSFAATRRRRDLGIRMAMGASRRAVIRLVMRQTLTSVTIGIALGAAAAALLTRLLQSLLFALTPNDPVTVLASALVLAGAAVPAILLPAWKASRIDPLITLTPE
jgi:putative ABC transport system permease protein